MRRLLSFAACTAAVAACLVLVAAVPVLAQPQYDTPTVGVLDAGFYQFTLEVRAGATGAPAGFVVDWMKKSDYDRLGGWPASGYDPTLVYCEFIGTPTLNTDPDSPTYKLAPNVEFDVQPGDLFDETGVETNYTDALEPGTAYVFRAYAAGDANGTRSGYASTFFARTTGGLGECTQGFWKNHPESWPAGCTPMLLGTVAYTQAQLLAIFATPAAGNGLIFLAHQLIAAKLNLCNGSDPTPIAATIAAADALIGGLVCPPIGAGFIDPAAASGLTETLDQYNNGKLGGVAECPTPVRKGTWGQLKSRYR